MTIRLSEYQQEVDDLEPGQTIRLNHESCTAGEDTRRRLYLTRPLAKPDSVVAFCHNCQESGFHQTGNYQQYRRELHKDGHYTTASVHQMKDVVERPPNLIEDTAQWPVPAIKWYAHNHLTSEDIERFDIAYDPATNRIYLPRYRVAFEHADGILQGYQLRKITTGNSPKYITCVTSEDKGFTCIPSENPTYHVVLVEDLVSGIHVHNAEPHAKVIVNYGVKTNLEALYAAKTAANFIVWLDNDNTVVRNQARSMLQTWNLLKDHRSKGYMVQDYSDPKHYQAEEIRFILTEARNG